MNAVKKFVDKAMEWLCIAMLAVMTILVTYQVITRYFFNRPSAMSENAAQYLFVWMVMFGSAYVFGSREHLSISLFKDRFPPLMNFIVEILINLSLFAFSAIVCAFGGYRVTIMQWNTLNAALQVSMGLIYISIPICGAVMLFYAVYNIMLAASEYKTNSRSASDFGSSTM